MNLRYIICIIMTLLIALPISAISFDSPISIYSHAPIKKDISGNSLNWAGYAVAGSNGSVSDVKGSWIVPAVTCTSTANQTSSSWVGIDGLNSPTVEQAGTSSECSGNASRYYVWFQFFPNSVSIINSMTVHPGDIMSAEVRYIGGLPSNGWFTVFITDVTTSNTFFKLFTVKGANRNSAEWIVEASSINGDIVPLANFGTEYFGLDKTRVRSTNFATVNGVTGSIGSFSSSSVMAITMVDSSGAAEAQPSPLSNGGTSFSVKWIGMSSPNGTIAGRVINASSGSPIQGAGVTAGGQTNITDADGNYTISIAPAEYNVTASATGYISSSTAVTVTSGAVSTQNFALQPTVASTCSGNVTVDKSQPLFSRDIGLTSAHIMAQRFIPSSRCLTKLKVRIINSVPGHSLVVEIRKDSGGFPLDGPNGLIGSVKVPYSSFPFYSLPETPYNFADTEINLSMVVPLEPLHIVMFTDDYSPTRFSQVYYHVVFYEYSNPTEYLQYRYGGTTWTKRGQLYYNTYKQTYG